jgi:drug/metabolite transporter (DMT)-like permease
VTQIILFTALLTRITNNNRLSSTQWISLFVIMSGLGTSRIGALHGIRFISQIIDMFLIAIVGKQHPQENTGILLSLCGTLCYAVVYALNERILGPQYRVPPRLLCRSLGIISTCVFAIYLCFYTIPNLNTLFLIPIAAQGTNLYVVLLLYLLIMVSSYIHNISYFVMMSDFGAVTTGVLSSVRAVLIFGLSSVMYCRTDPTQCYTGMKAISTILVAVGVLLFSSGKHQAKTFTSDDELSPLPLI